MLWRRKDFLKLRRSNFNNQDLLRYDRYRQRVASQNSRRLKGDSAIPIRSFNDWLNRLGKFQR